MWNAVNLQLIVFPVDPQIGVKSQWWQELTGLDEYESKQKRAERTDDGECDGFGLKLEIDLLRTTWTRGALMAGVAKGLLDVASGQEPTIPTLGEFVAASNSFRDLMHRWLSTNCPPIYRVSFAGQLFWKQPSREAAYLKLGDWLPMKLDPNATDFSYQINRKRRSTIIDGEINRLRTWSASKLEVVIQANENTKTPYYTEFGSTLRFDVNTPAENKVPFATAILCNLFDELMESAKDIAARGDVA